MIEAADIHRMIRELGEVAAGDIEWAETRQPPTDAEDFALEVIFVICNSGMKYTVAAGIYLKCRALLHAGCAVKGNILGKSGKAAAIDGIWADRDRLLAEYNAAPDKVWYARTQLPWIGGITAYHVAKNFGAQVAKPDVHLQRLADREGTTAQALCERLAAATGYKVPTIDTILWRACATGLLNSKTGEFRS